MSAIERFAEPSGHKNNVTGLQEVACSYKFSILLHLIPSNPPQAQLLTLFRPIGSGTLLKMSYTSALATRIQNPQLRVLNALRADKKPILTFLGLQSFRTAQIVASTGLDGVIIDCEHGNITDDAMHNAIAAVSSQGVSPLVRVKMSHPDLIKRALDAGAHGIVVPMVNSADEAYDVVQNAKFPPQGLRGQGSAFPGFALGIDATTYIKTANETLITCLQIESKMGVENVDSICAVPGVGK